MTTAPTDFRIITYSARLLHTRLLSLFFILITTPCLIQQIQGTIHLLRVKILPCMLPDELRSWTIVLPDFAMLALSAAEFSSCCSLPINLIAILSVCLALA